MRVLLFALDVSMLKECEGACLARGGVVGGWIRGLGLGIPLLCKQEECWTCVSVFGLRCYWWRSWEVRRCLDQVLEG